MSDKSAAAPVAEKEKTKSAQAPSAVPQAEGMQLPASGSLSAAGNQAMQRLLRKGVIQASLAVSQPDDPLEQEAEAAANNFRKNPVLGSGYSARQVIHRAARAGGAAQADPEILRPVLNSPGRDLPPTTRKEMETYFGEDFAAVRVHTDPGASRSAEALAANAYTYGTHIVFRNNLYVPETHLGRKLLAHELTHVMQQGGTPRLVQRQLTPQAGDPAMTAVLNVGDLLNAYTILRQSISANQWAGLNQAANDRMNRQYARRGLPAESAAAGAVHPLIEITVSAGTLLRPEEPGSDENFSTRLFTAMTTSGGDFMAAGGITRDHIAYLWYHSSPSALRANVRIALIDPQGETELPPGLTFQIDNHPIATEDGGLYLGPVDQATSKYLPAITEQVNTEVQRVARAADLNSRARAVIDFGRTLTGRSPTAVASEDFSQFIGVLTDLKQRIQTYNESNPETSGLLGSISTELTTFIDGSARPFATRIESERQTRMPGQSLGETMLGQASGQMETQRRLMEQAGHQGFWESIMTMYTAGLYGRSAGASSASYMTANLLTGNQLEVSRELHQAFRGGRISLDDFQSGVSQAHTLGAIIGSINAILMIATMGLAGPVLGAAPGAGAVILYGGTSAALSTAIPMTVSSIYSAYHPLQGDLAQQIWTQGSYHTPGEIAGSSLLSFGIGAGLSAIGPVFNWFSNRTNAQLARALAVASAEGRPLTSLPNVQSAVVSPGVVEITVTGQPGVIRVTRTGWQVVMRAGTGQQTVITEQAWGELHPSVAGGIENRFPALSGIQDTALMQPQGGIPIRFGVTQEGYFALAPQARNPMTVGMWGQPQGTGQMPIMLGGGAGGVGGRPFFQLPSGPPAPRQLYSGQVVIDLQGGDTRFTSGMVASLPGSRGYTVESGAWMLGYQGITRTVSPSTGGMLAGTQDLDLALQIARNSPRWNFGTPVSQLGGELPPGLNLEQIDPAGQLFAQPQGVSLIPEPFFPPRGMGGRLIPLPLGGQPAQADVGSLLTTSHPELWDQGTQIYLRRPFALQAASPAQADAMGQEINRMLRPGGFTEFRLLRSGDRRIARTIAAQVPGAEIVEVDQRAIRTFVDSGYSTLPSDTRQAEILRNAESDLRAGGLGGGNFNSIIRIYKPAGG